MIILLHTSAWEPFNAIDQMNKLKTIGKIPTSEVTPNRFFFDFRFRLTISEVSVFTPPNP